MRRCVARAVLGSVVVVGALVACAPDLLAPDGLKIECSTDAQCPEGSACVAGVGLCASTTSPSPCVVPTDSGFQVAVDGDDCVSDEVPSGGVCIAGKCRVSRCGDGVVAVSLGEQCDSGGEVSETCNAFCRECGNGIVDQGEDCDEGEGLARANPNDGCTSSCRAVLWSVDTGAPLIGAGFTPSRLELDLSRPWGLAVDRAGNTYVASYAAHRIDRIGVDGQASTFAGTGDGLFVGDGGPAASLSTPAPRALQLDSKGNLYFVASNRLMRVCGDATECVVGHLEVVAFSGEGPGVGPIGDGGPAIDAKANVLVGIAVTPDYFVVSDEQLDRVRAVDRRTGIIDTIIDDTTVLAPRDLALDADGNLLIADFGNHRILRYEFDGGAVTTVLGTGTGGTGCASGAAPDVNLRPSQLEVTADGALLIAGGGCVWRVRPDGATFAGQTVEHLAGTGTQGFSGDGGAATAAELNHGGLASDPRGNVLISQITEHRVRRVCVDATTCDSGTIDTFIGSGRAGFYGDGGPATSARVEPDAIALGPNGDLFIADATIFEVRRVCRSGIGCEPGTIDRVAGIGLHGRTGDGGSALDARLQRPDALAVGPDGTLFIADDVDDVIRRVDGATGVITTYAGGGASVAAVGMAATDVRINDATSLTVDGEGNLFVADSGQKILWWVDRASGLVAHRFDDTNAGASFNPLGVTTDPAGDVYVSNGGSNGIFKVNTGADPSLTEVVPIGVGPEFLATELAVDAGGNVYIVDGVSARERVFRACVDGVGCTPGTFSLFAGAEGTFGGLGDGEPAVDATFISAPSDVAVAANGDVFIAANSGVRRVCAGESYCAPGIIETFAGEVYPRDDRFDRARLGGGRQMTWLASNVALIADGPTGRLRRVSFGTSAVDTVFGYRQGTTVEGSPARFFDRPATVGGVAVFDDGSSPRILLATDAADHLREIVLEDPAEPKSWTTTAFAVQPDPVAGALSGAAGLAYDATLGRIYVVEADAHVVRAVDVATGASTLIAGVPDVAGYFGDDDDPTDGNPHAGVAPLAAIFRQPVAIALGPVVDGVRSLYVAEAGGHRIRRITVDAEGTPLKVTSVTGLGVAATVGDGLPARAFPASEPRGLAVDSYGNLFFSSGSSVRVVEAGDDGLATGDDGVRTVYGPSLAEGFPQNATRCLSAVSLAPDDESNLYVLDGCQGYLLRLVRE